jgi:hypothetical protein
MNSTTPALGYRDGQAELRKELGKLGFDDGADLGRRDTATARFEHFDLVTSRRGIGGELNCLGTRLRNYDGELRLWSLEFTYDTPVDVVIGAISGAFAVTSAQDDALSGRVDNGG